MSCLPSDDRLFYGEQPFLPESEVGPKSFLEHLLLAVKDCCRRRRTPRQTREVMNNRTPNQPQNIWISSPIPD